jgi:hypothetical protein
MSNVPLSSTGSMRTRAGRGGTSPRRRASMEGSDRTHALAVLNSYARGAAPRLPPRRGRGRRLPRASDST